MESTDSYFEPLCHRLSRFLLTPTEWPQQAAGHMPRFDYGRTRVPQWVSMVDNIRHPRGDRLLWYSLQRPKQGRGMLP